MRLIEMEASRLVEVVTEGMTAIDGASVATLQSLNVGKAVVDSSSGCGSCCDGGTSAGGDVRAKGEGEGAESTPSENLLAYSSKMEIFHCI